MRLKSAPDACPAINVAGTEYSPDADGFVNISNPVHIACALETGFTQEAESHEPVEETTIHQEE